MPKVATVSCCFLSERRYLLVMYSSNIHAWAIFFFFFFNHKNNWRSSLHINDLRKKSQIKKLRQAARVWRQHLVPAKQGASLSTIVIHVMIYPAWHWELTWQPAQLRLIDLLLPLLFSCMCQMMGCQSAAKRSFCLFLPFLAIQIPVDTSSHYS